MFDFIFEILFEAIGVLVASICEAIFNIVAELIFSGLFRALGHLFPDVKPPRFAAEFVGALVLGALSGYASTLILPHQITPPSKLPGSSLLLAPLVAGSVMQAIGSWRKNKGGVPTFLETFAGGGAFAFAMAFVRWWLIGAHA